jgi:ISXO2-like transposase domain/Transposase zinc-ribbon domain
MNTTRQMTFRELLARFPDEVSCKAFLAAKRWPDGVVKCPCCGAKAYTLKARPFHYLCKSGAQTANKETGEVVTCGKKNGYRFSVITRTVFENTNYPLREWFRVIFLMFHSKKGMSAHQIHRMLGTGSYETAWYMCQRIRASMKDSQFAKLMGNVEIDETYIGGQARNRHKSQQKHRRGGWDKTPVIGAISRKGNVTCRMIEHADVPTMDRFVRQVVDTTRVKLVATDEHAGYMLLKRSGVPHESVSHRQGEYVRGQVHTQSIESFWSLLKRGVIGSYHNVSKKYLPLYLNEFTFRFNNRKNPYIFDLIVAGC